MRARGPKDWNPRARTERHGSEEWLDQFPGRTPQFDDLVRHLRAVVLIGGEGYIGTDKEGPVYISIVHDGSGFNPAAAIAVSQNRYHDLSQDTLEEAFEILEDHDEKNVEHVRELQEEWGDRWEEILTEAYEGKTWVFKDPVLAASAILTVPGMRKYIEIEDARESRE